MRESKLNAVLVVAVLAIAFAAPPLTARVDVKVEFDKTFNFKQVKTWGWDQAGPGQVKMARTVDDDPEAVRKRAEPIIVDAVTTMMKQRGLEPATAEPDLAVTYYLLLTSGISAQTMGQFLPATTGWGLPPFAQATQSMEMMNHGSLVIDLSAKQTVVWRGLAQAKIQLDADEKRREALMREAVRDLLRRYPPRQ